MAYCFIATTNKKIDWRKLHSEIFNPDSSIEMFPVSTGKPDLFYIGINIPFSKLGTYPDTWNVLVEIINKLKEGYAFEIFDLYNGFFVNDSNIEQVKKSLAV